MLALLLVLVWPAASQAGTYEVWSCAGPNGEPLPADGWRAEGSGYFSSPTNDCAAQNGLYGLLNGSFDHAANTEIVTWHFQVPTNLKIVGYRLWRAARTDPNSYNASPVYWMARQSNQYTGAYVVGPENCPGCGGLGNVTAHFAPENLVTETGLADVRDLFLNAGCGGASGFSCLAGASTTNPETVYFRMYRSAVVLQDDSDPVFTSPPAGSLTAGGTLAGPQGVSFSATDTGSGIYQAVVEVDGRAAATQTFGCAPPFSAVAPCKPAASGTVTLDTATLADGAHSVRVLLTDATGTNQAAFGPFSITTSNAPTICAPAAAPNLGVRFDRRRATIAFGGRLNVRGTLPGAPAGTPIRVLSQVKRTGAPAKLGRTALTTDAQGRFTYKVPAGPSRTLRFAYRSATDPVLQCSRVLGVAVRARVSLTAKAHTGRRVRLSGRLRGGYVPARGKLVELQAFDGGKWRSVKTVRSSAKGSFHYTYRFSRGAARKRYPFRAAVRPDDGYPWARGTSRRVSVRVR